MSPLKTFCVALAICLSWPVAAAAQGRSPHDGTMAIGADIGAFMPDDEFDSTFIVGGAFEFYPAARVSIRPGLSYTSPEFDRDARANLRQVRLGVDAIYNWEQGAWHPFVGAGIGMHLMKLEDRGNEVDDETELGISLLGGTEYFVSPRTALKFEGRYQFVDDVLAADPGGFALTIGVKRYF